MTVRGNRAALAWVLPALLLACAGEGEEGGYALPDLQVQSIEPATWLNGTRVRLGGQGFVPPGAGAMTATLSGEAGGRTFAVKVDVALEGPERASFAVSPGMLQYLPVDGGTYTGTLDLERHGDRLDAARVQAPFRIEVVSWLTPVLEALGPTVTTPGESIAVQGGGFLLSGEGTTLVRLSGRLRLDGDPVPRTVPGLYVPISVSQRDRGTFVLTPDILGLGPGDFTGQATVVNRIGDQDVVGGGRSNCSGSWPCRR